MSDHWTRERTQSAPVLTWPQIEHRLLSLWPEWSASDAILTEWKSALAGLNLEWVDAAISDVYRSRPGKEPRLPHVLSSFGRIAKEWADRREAGVAGGPTKLERDKAERDQCNAAHAALVNELRRVHGDELAAALAYVRHVASRLAGKATGADPGQWSQMLVGLVWAALRDPSAAEWIARAKRDAASAPATHIPASKHEQAHQAAGVNCHG